MRLNNNAKTIKTLIDDLEKRREKDDIKQVPLRDVKLMNAFTIVKQ